MNRTDTLPAPAATHPAWCDPRGDAAGVHQFGPDHHASALRTLAITGEGIERTASIYTGDGETFIQMDDMTDWTLDGAETYALRLLALVAEVRAR